MKDLGSSEGIPKAKFEIISWLKGQEGYFSMTATSHLFKPFIIECPRSLNTKSFGKGE